MVASRVAAGHWACVQLSVAPVPLSCTIAIMDSAQVLPMPSLGEPLHVQNVRLASSMPAGNMDAQDVRTGVEGGGAAT